MTEEQWIKERAIDLEATEVAAAAARGQIEVSVAAGFVDRLYS
jgi:hypothetical protein